MFIKNTIAAGDFFHFYRELGNGEICYLEIKDPRFARSDVRGFIEVPADIMDTVARSWLALRARQVV